MSSPRPKPHPPLAEAELAALGEALEAVASWVRRATPRGEFNAVTLSTLDAVGRLGPQRVTDLLARERISQPGMTGVVARLVEAGFVERRPDPADGRASSIAVTDAGLAYLRAVHAARAAALVEHVRALPPHQQRALQAAGPALAALGARPISSESQS